MEIKISTDGEKTDIYFYSYAVGTSKIIFDTKEELDLFLTFVEKASKTKGFISINNIGRLLIVEEPNEKI